MKRLLLLLVLGAAAVPSAFAGGATYRQPGHGIGQPAFYGEINRNGQVYLYRVGPKPYKPYDYRELMGRPTTRTKR